MRLRDKKVRTFILLPIALIALATILTQLFLPSIKSTKNEGTAFAANLSKDTLVLGTIATYSFDLENPTGLENPETIVEGKGTSGNHLCVLNDKVEFGTTFSKKSDEIKNFKTLKEISFSFQVIAEGATTDLVAVCSFETPKGEAIDWQGQDVLPTSGKWEKKTFSFPISDKVTQSQGKLKLYVWNKGHHNFKVDDLSIELKGMMQARLNNTASITENYITWDFESAHPGLTDLSGITTAEHVSGTHSYHFTAERTFGPTLSKHVGEVAPELKLITITAWIKPVDDDPDIYLVAEAKSQDGSGIYYEARNTRASKEGFPVGKWKKLRAQFKLPGDKISPNDIINVYIWNKTESEFYADDLEVVYGEQHVRSGSEPLVNTSLLPTTGYSFHLPDGPLPLLTIPKITLKNNDSPLPDGSAPVYPFYPQASGKFIATAQGTDQLLVVSPSSIALYAYCETQHGFHMLSSTPIGGLAGWIGAAQLCAGDFDHDGRDEAFLYNPTTAAGKLIRFPATTTASSCSGITEKPAIMDVRVKSPEATPSAFSQVAIGDFNGDGRAEFIIAEPGTATAWTGALTKEGSFAVQALLNVTALQELKSATALSLNTIRTTAGSALMVSWDVTGHGNCKAVRLNNTCSAFQSYNTGLESISASGALTIFNGDFSPAYKSAALVIDRSWKFNARFVEGSGAAAQLYRFDFTGFKPGKNPKYYEQLSLVAGEFVHPGQMNLVAVMCNCNDANHSAKGCKSVSTEATLPPSFQLYSF